jgi:hypothetical protein
VVRESLRIEPRDPAGGAEAAPRTLSVSPIAAGRPSAGRPSAVRVPQRAAEDVLAHIDPARARMEDGRVFEGRIERPLSEYWQDREVASRLWSVTESMIAAKTRR